jgi:hypothetical protein
MAVEQTIVQKVSANLGFEVKDASVKAEETTIASQFIPFFNITLDDQSTFKNEEIAVAMQFNDLQNITQRSGRARFPNIKALSVITNPHTQQILKIASAWPKSEAAIAPFPNAAEEEKQLRMKGEKFIALPAGTPSVDFYTALKKLDLAGPISPKKAKQVMAYYVVHSTIRYSDRAVWIIQTRGIDLEGEGYAAQRHGIPVDARNHMRHIIDAVTGDWLFSDTTPQPV